jgi:hypothetical protein
LEWDLVLDDPNVPVTLLAETYCEFADEGGFDSDVLERIEQKFTECSDVRGAFEVLYRSGNRDLIGILSRSHRLTEREQMLLAENDLGQDFESQVLCYWLPLAENLTTSPSALRLLPYRDDPLLLAALAGNPATPLVLLEEVATEMGE